MKELAQVLLPIAILGSLGVSLYFIIKAITEFIIKKRMIDKGIVGADASELLKTQKSENKLSALKWGLIILFAGIGLVIIEVLPTDPSDSPFLPFGILAICISLGFLLYFFLVQKMDQE